MTADNRAVYDYEKMIDYLVKIQHMTCEDAVEYIDFNFSYPLGGEKGPVILYSFE